ncbi:MAG: hypothetical protein QM790_05395 [Nibricoccus sp.]
MHTLAFIRPLLFTLFAVAVMVTSARAADNGETALTWTSKATGEVLRVAIHEPAIVDAAAPTAVPTVIYLLNLAAPRVGTDSDETILIDFMKQGFRVITLDYAKNPKARVPALNVDLGKLRDDIYTGKFPYQGKLDQAHIYIVPSGHRLLRDIVFYRDRERTLAFDVIYPSRPAKPTGVVLEFSCDNKDRFGNSSLSMCSDTILDAEATEGLAVAMADHPVAAPYKGLDPMPDCAWKIKSAVRTLRTTARNLGLGEKVVPVGFSRGSGMALMLVTTANMKDFEGHGEHLDIDSSVQGAVVMSGRFTYLDLLKDDHMISRYEKAWGTRDSATDKWRKHGALDYLQKPTVPIFLTINCSESPDALHQMEVLRRRLTELKSPFTYLLDDHPRGHKVTLEPALLSAMDAYIKSRLL